jgi:hypothetical protein
LHILGDEDGVSWRREVALGKVDVVPSLGAISRDLPATNPICDRAIEVKMVALMYLPYNAPPISPKPPGMTSRVLTRSKNDQSEIPAIASMTIVEKRMPPLKKALPRKRTPVPTKPLSS